MTSLIKTETVCELLVVLSQWIEQEISFTCFDVTNELRDNGHSDVRHSAVRELIHGLHGLSAGPFREFKYVRSTESFTTSGGLFDTAEVYKHPTCNDDYNPDWRSQQNQTPYQNVGNVVFTPTGVVTKTVPFPVVTSTVTVAPVAQKTEELKDISPDARGRVCVRKHLMVHSRLNRQCLADVVCVGRAKDGEVYVTDDITSPSEYLGCLKVDKNRQNVRIPASMLRRAGISGNVNMAAVDNKVVLTKV